MDHLYNAIKKCRHQYNRHWGGYLIPKEILALKELGVDCKGRGIELALDRKQRGINNATWFYFNANKKFEILKERFK